MSKHKNPKLLEKLKALTDDLTRQAKELDNYNLHSKAISLAADSALFSNRIFVTQSDKFSDYAKEINKNITSLKRLLLVANNTLAFELLQKVEQQILALSTGLKANDIRQKEAAYRRHAVKASKQKVYQKAVEQVILPTQQLYQNLSEHHEFERRLAEMIIEREQQRHTANTSQTTRLNQEILALHQRLGRCRQAISKIEQQIELSEKR